MEKGSLRTLLLVSSIALFLAVLPIFPYGYYILLRILICGASAYFAFWIKEQGKYKPHFVPLIIIALLFNPLIPIHLAREIWFPIDIGVGIYFLVLISKLKGN